MANLTMIVLQGLPGSGKTMHARALQRAEPGRWVRVNRDDIRVMMGMTRDTWSHAAERLVRRVRDDMIRSALFAGCDVIIDDTNLVSRTVNGHIAIANAIGGITVIVTPIDAPIDTCILRDSQRSPDERVGERVIRDMARRGGLWTSASVMRARTLHMPTRAQRGCTIVTGLPRAVICDLDGTLSLNVSGREIYDGSRCDEDAPCPAVLEILRAEASRGIRIVLMSGREERWRSQTVAFLTRCLTDDRGKPLTYELHMRATDDKRRDSIVKRELHDACCAGRYDVLFVLDDRPSVVRMWRRELGLTVMQLDDVEF